MAITYDGANGLFTRLGKLVGMMDAVRTHQNNLKTELADVQSVYSSADSYMIEQLVGNLEARIAQSGGVLNDIRAAAERTLIEMCYADAKTSTRNAMENRTVRDALVWLIREMSADAESVDETTNSKGAISYGASNNGNGVLATFSECPNILLSNTSVWPNCRTELIDVRCIQDAQDGSIASGSEVFEIRGQPGFDELDYRFPGGSGKRVRMTCVSGHVDAGPRGQNILSNSDFEDQSSNVPLLFTVTSGTAGTDFLTETGTYWRGAKSIKAAATGATWEIRQQLGTSSGTVGKIVPDRPYMISVALKRDVGATGTLRVSLKDGSGNILSGGLMAITQGHGAISTSWGVVNTTVFSPRIVPTTVYLSVECTVGIATAAMYIDEVTVAEMTQLGNGGPYFGLVAGSSDWNADDNVRVNWTNGGEGAFNTAFDRLFRMNELGLALPSQSGGTETIDDALIS